MLERKKCVGASVPEDADYILKLQLSGFLYSMIQWNKVQTLQKVSTIRAASTVLPARKIFIAICILHVSTSSVIFII